MKNDPPLKLLGFSAKDEGKRFHKLWGSPLCQNRTDRGICAQPGAWEGRGGSKQSDSSQGELGTPARAASLTQLKLCENWKLLFQAEQN